MLQIKQETEQWAKKRFECPRCSQPQRSRAQCARQRCLAARHCPDYTAREDAYHSTLNQGVHMEWGRGRVRYAVQILCRDTTDSIRCPKTRPSTARRARATSCHILSLAGAFHLQLCCCSVLHSGVQITAHRLCQLSAASVLTTNRLHCSPVQPLQLESVKMVSYSTSLGQVARLANIRGAQEPAML